MLDAGCGALMYDGWTQSGTHYVGLFVCYVRKQKGVEEGESVMVEIPEILLISCQPMAKICNEGKPDSEDVIHVDKEVGEISSLFNAEVHAHHFKKISSPLMVLQ